VLTSEILGGAAGGMRRRRGLPKASLETIVTGDLEKMLGLRGLTFFTNSFQIHKHGRNSARLCRSFNTISNIEALATTRLSEIWLEQNSSTIRSASASVSSPPTPSSSSAITACS